MTATENVRAFLAERKKMRGLDPDVVIAANGKAISIADLTKLCIMAEAFEMEHPSRAAAVEHGGCTKECFHLRA